MTPQGQQSVKPVVYSATDSSTYVQYTAAVPSGTTSVDIQLAAPSDVKTSGGQVSFTKANGYNRADFTDQDGETGALNIESVNGLPVTAAKYVYNVPVVNGKVTFRVGNATADTAGSAVPVVYAPYSGTDYLATDANGTPTGDFGVGGETTVATNEAPANDYTGVTVDSAGSDSFVGTTTGGTTYRFVYGNGDTYQVGGVGTTSSAFQQALSSGDTVNVTGYKPVGAAGTHSAVYNITDDVTEAPTNVVGTLRDTNLDGTADDLKLTFTVSQSGLQSGANAAQVRRVTVTNGKAGDFKSATAAPETVTYSGNVGTIDLGTPPAAGTYQYEVSVKGLVGSSYSDWSSPSNNVTVPDTTQASVDGAPTSDVAAYQDNNNNGNIDSGDVLRVTFDEAMNAPASDASIELTDTDGTIGTVTNGQNSTWVLGANGKTIVITLTGGPVVDTAGSTAGVQYGAQVTDASGVQDLPTNNSSGHAEDWDLSGSADTTF